jgi:hypothetical protein
MPEKNHGALTVASKKRDPPFPERLRRIYDEEPSRCSRAEAE